MMETDYEPISTSDDFGKLSKFNSAGLVNSTLNNLWQDFFRHYRDGKFKSANNDLDCIWTILGGEKGIERSETEQKYFEIEKKMAESGTPQNDLQSKGFSIINIDFQLKKYSTQKVILQEKAMFLRRLQNSQGKGTAYNDEDEGDFD